MIYTHFLPIVRYVCLPLSMLFLLVDVYN
jgi:hypothetical protein